MRLIKKSTDRQFPKLPHLSGMRLVFLPVAAAVALRLGLFHAPVKESRRKLWRCAVELFPVRSGQR